MSLNHVVHGRTEPIIHRERNPVFVVGHSRSGTSILTTLIRKHLEIAFGTESQFIVRLAKVAARAGSLRDDEIRRRFIDTLSRERFFARTRKNYGLVLDMQAAVSDSAGGTYRDVLDAVFSQLATHMKFARWGDKTPEYALHLPLLYQLYPEARFVNVVRDGRDVALSIFETQFGAKNLYVAARDWRECLAAVESFRQSQPGAHLLDVRYEDLLRTPEQVFSALIRFFDIDDEKGQLGERLGRAVREGIRAGNSEKWKQRLSPSEQRLFESVAGQWLSRYHYERSHVTAAPVGALEAAFWTADDLARRISRAGYWRDTLYRVGLRLGPAGRPLRLLGKSASRNTRH